MKKSVLFSLVTVSLLAACGKPATSITRDNAAVDPAPGHNVSASTNGTQTNSPLLNALLGTYYGRFQGWTLDDDGFDQPYTLAFSTTQTNGVTTGKFVFNSPGDIPFNLTLKAGPGVIQGAYSESNTAILFNFVSEMFTLPNVSSTPVVLEIIIALKGNYVFDPTQSSVHLRDCGFSGGLDCSRQLQDVWFVQGLGKR